MLESDTTARLEDCCGFMHLTLFNVLGRSISNHKRTADAICCRDEGYILLYSVRRRSSVVAVYRLKPLARVKRCVCDEDRNGMERSLSSILI